MNHYQVEIEGECFEVEIWTVGGKHHAIISTDSSRQEAILTPRIDGEIEIRLVNSDERLRAVPSTGSEPQEVRMIARGHDVIARVSSERDRLRSVSSQGTKGPRRHVIASEIPGVVRAVRVKVGDEVDEGAPLLTLEAMKMENKLQAPEAGRIEAVLVRPGAVVAAGEPLIELQSDSETAPPADA